MVHGGDHRLHGLAVCEGQDADLGTGKKLLNDDVLAALAEDLIRHHGLDGLLGLLPGLGNDDTLAQGQAVSLDDRRNGGGFQIPKGRVHIVEDLVLRRGNAVLLHQILGEDLAALDDGGVGLGAEAGNALAVQGIHRPQDQRIVWGHYGVIDFILYRKIYNFPDIRGPDGNADRVLRHTPVAGEGVYRFYGLIFFQLLDDGVLPPAAADYQNLHIDQPFLNTSSVRAAPCHLPRWGSLMISGGTAAYR